MNRIRQACIDFDMQMGLNRMLIDDVIAEAEAESFSDEQKATLTAMMDKEDANVKP